MGFPDIITIKRLGYSISGPKNDLDYCQIIKNSLSWAKTANVKVGSKAQFSDPKPKTGSTDCIPPVLMPLAFTTLSVA